MTVGKALANTWKQNEIPLDQYLDWDHTKALRPIRTPLFDYLTYNYKERYVKLCARLGIEPVSLGKWLRKNVSSIQ